MMKSNKQKLSFQITKIIIFAMLLLIVFQAVYTIDFYRYRNRHLKEANEIVASSIEITLKSMIEDVKASSLAFAFNENVGGFVTSKDMAKRYELSLEINKLTRFIWGYNEEVKDIILITKEKNVYAFKEGISNMVSKKVYGKFTIDELLNGDQECFFANHEEGKEGYELMIFKTPIYSESSESSLLYEENGVILFEINTRNLYESVSRNQQYSNIELIIVDKYNNEIEIGHRINDEEDYIVANKSLEDYGIEIYVKTPKDYFSKESKYFLVWLIVTLIVFVLMVSMVGYLVYAKITSPIDNLMKEIRQLHEKGRKKHVEYNKDEVISIIGDEINKLMDKNRAQTKRILETQRKLYELEISEKEAQFHALQLQINPHFLYNTLSCIKAMALVHNRKDIASMLTSLSRIFRYSIKNEKSVQVMDEVGFIKEYLKIMKERYSDEFSFSIEIDEDIKMSKSLKMILQPIVENAIEHGIETKRNKGYIKIVCKKEGENLIYYVIDNGLGFSDERLNEIRKMLRENKNKSNSIGMVNVNRRIQNNYGENYGIEILITKEETIVKIVQPYIEN